MKIFKGLIRKSSSVFAFIALLAAHGAATQFSYIYYQELVPEKVRALKK